MNKIIEVRNLVKTYGKRSSAFTALNNINLDIYEGESVAIVGKSGSGKSTLMHLLALLDHPTSGTITIAGVDSTKLGARRVNQLRNRSFGFVFQQFFINPSDTVLQNVTLPLKIAGVRRKTRHNLAMRALEIVGLSDRVKFKANDLSGGQKQRVCIARAVVNNPKIIFADEPTGNLDSATGEKIVNLLFEFNKERNATLIIVTHDEDLAAKCSRMVRIIDGQIVSDTRNIARSASTAPTLSSPVTAEKAPAPEVPVAPAVSPLPPAPVAPPAPVIPETPATPSISAPMPPMSSAQPLITRAPESSSEPRRAVTSNMPTMPTAERPPEPKVTPTKGVI